MLCFGQSSWSADAVVADVEDPVRLEKARRAVERAKKRLGLNKSPKIGIKAAK